MRAFLGRTAFIWQPFLITVIGFSLLALWAANLPSGEDYLFGPPEAWLWLAFTFLIGAPGMGTACAIVGARTGQVGWAGVTGLAGLVVPCLGAALLDGATVGWDMAFLFGVPFLVGFGAGAKALSRVSDDADQRDRHPGEHWWAG